MSLEDTVRASFEAAGQTHVFRFFEAIPEEDRKGVLDRLKLHDPQQLQRQLKKAQVAAATISERLIRPPSLVDFGVVRRRAAELAKQRGEIPSEATSLDTELVGAFRDVVAESACPVVAKGDVPEELRRAWRRLGLEWIAAGRVCVVLLAGGDGTRLGFPGPKGALPVGPVSRASLFQLFVERIRRVQTLARRAAFSSQRSGDEETGAAPCAVPLLVMTSVSNHAATEKFFRENAFFGLRKADVEFFPQGSLPVFDFNGRLILRGPVTLAEAPDGNGGLFEALLRSGALRRMKERGVACFHVLAVDNALAKPADPTFVGLAASTEAQVANKVVARRAPNESVGLMCQLLTETELSVQSRSSDSEERNEASRWRGAVVEYSELPEELRVRTVPADADSKQALAYRWGNVCMHIFSLSFVETLCSTPQLEERKFHCAKKKVPFWGPADSTANCALEECSLQTPEKPNGWKLEQFIFDVFPFASRVVCLEVAREEEFAPIKAASKCLVSKQEESLHNVQPCPVEEDTLEAAQQMLTALHSKWMERDSFRCANPSRPKGPVCEVSPLVSYEGEGLEDHCADGINTKYGLLVSPCNN